jgi:indole-3-glycerol phosphate synthase
MELQRALDGGARLIGVNNRDLRTFNVDLATAERLAPLIPSEIVRVAESGIKTAEDVRRLQRAGFNALLVGESLLRQSDRARAVEELMAATIVEKRS